MSGAKLVATSGFRKATARIYRQAGRTAARAKTIEEAEMKFLLVPLRLLISPAFIAAVDVMILFPMVLSVLDILQSVNRHSDTHEPVTIASTIALIMIGWGVALEERAVIRKRLGVTGGADEERQVQIDEMCHEYGVAQLVLGLFAEIAVAMISLPDRIVNTVGYEHTLLTVSVILISIGALIQLRHVFVLIATLWRHKSVPGRPA